MRKLTIGLIALLSLTLVGCGFHLRKPDANQLAWSSLTVQSGDNYHFVKSEINRQIGSNRVTFSQDGQAATLIIGQEHFGERDLSYSRTGEVRRKRISYRMSFTVLDNEQNAILGPSTITAARDQLLNPAQDLADNIEVADIKKNLQKEAIYLLFLQLEAYHPDVH